MRFKKISFIILVGLLVAGCSGSSNYSISKTVTVVKDYPEDQNHESSEVTKITLPANKLYPQENEDKGILFVPSFAYEKSFVDIKAEFFVEMDEIYYGKEDSEIRKSTSESDGRNWHGEVETKNRVK
ncbi:MAG: hypothetical protein R2883_00475 [Caldisericia bacterium]